jgi:DUF4097 and DUF4098 domain-containing protein YvlB
MKRLAAFAFVVAAAGCAIPSRAEVRDEFHKTYPLTATGRVSVSNVNGPVRITAWDRNEVKVDAVKRGRTERALEDARIIVDARADSVEIRTQYPEHSRDAASVEYTLSVPRHAALEGIGTVNGPVEIDGVIGGIRASSVNGNVAVRHGEGDADLHTTNGRVEADFARLGGAVSAKTVNGGIVLTLPRDASARLTAKTVHGGIHSDFALPVRRVGFGPGGDIVTVIGDGGADVRLSTVNGAIDLRRQ